MKREIIDKLITLNTNFYNEIAPFFDNSRQYNWNGWEKILNFLNNNLKENSNFLDLGCGNGRFAGFLKNNFKKSFEYFGVDNNKFLISQAKNNFEDKNIKFFEKNIFDVDLNSNLSDNYDVISIFGVMHHIPSEDLRINWLKNFTNLLNTNGFLILSFWNFLDDKRLRNKIKNINNKNILKNELEKNDYLLGWDRGINSVRYCHYFDNEEVQNIAKELGLKIISKFNAEGKENNLNTYLILKKV